MPPAGEADGMADTRNAEPSRQSYRVILRRPDPIPGYFMLKTEPFGARRAVPVPVQARVVGENLNARPDHQKDQEQVEEMLPSQPRREAVVVPGRGADAWIARDE